MCPTRGAPGGGWPWPVGARRGGGPARSGAPAGSTPGSRAPVRSLGDVDGGDGPVAVERRRSQHERPPAGGRGVDAGTAREDLGARRGPAPHRSPGGVVDGVDGEHDVVVADVVDRSHVHVGLGHGGAVDQQSAGAVAVRADHEPSVGEPSGGTGGPLDPRVVGLEVEQRGLARRRVDVAHLHGPLIARVHREHRSVPVPRRGDRYGHATRSQSTAVGCRRGGRRRATRRRWWCRRPGTGPRWAGDPGTSGRRSTSAARRSGRPARPGGRRLPGTTRSRGSDPSPPPR